MSVQNEAADQRSAAVYRLYDMHGRLLYIGSAYDPDHRCKAHHSKPWWRQVARRDDEWCGTRRAAYLAEMQALASEGPEHNDFGTPDYRTPKTQAVVGRSELLKRQGQVQSAAWKAWRRVRAEALVDGLPLSAATEVAEAARFAVIKGSGLFPRWVERQEDRGRQAAE